MRAKAGNPKNCKPRTADNPTVRGSFFAIFGSFCGKGVAIEL